MPNRNEFRLQLDDQESADTGDSLLDILESNLSETLQEGLEHFGLLETAADAFDKVRESGEGLGPGANLRPELPEDWWEAIERGDAEIIQKSDDTYGAVVRRTDGKQIEKHLKLRKVDPDAAEQLRQSARQVATQQMLKKALDKLETMDQKLDALLRGMTDDRIGQIKSGVEQYRQAIQFENPDNRRNALINAKQSIAEGRRKCLQNVKSELSEYQAPDGFVGKVRHLTGTKDYAGLHDRLKRQASEAIRATYVDVLINIELDEPKAARSSLEDLKQLLGHRERRQLSKLARHKPYVKDDAGYYPEEFWKDGVSSLIRDVRRGVRKLESNQSSPITIPLETEETNHE